MTKHQLAEKVARLRSPAYMTWSWRGDPDMRVRGARRHRKTWLAKKHRKAVKIALAVKANKARTR